MSGPGDPPEGTPNGAPGGGEDEYRSVVFDESFVRAARLQEFSADERLGEHHAPAVKARHRSFLRAGGPRQAILLVVLIVLAFGTAVYMGVRHPYRTPDSVRVQPMRSAVVPLAPGRRRAGSEARRSLRAQPGRGLPPRRGGGQSSRRHPHRALLRRPGRLRADHRQGLPRPLLAGSGDAHRRLPAAGPAADRHRPARPVRPEPGAPGRRRAERRDRLAGALRPPADPARRPERTRQRHALRSGVEPGRTRHHRRLHLRLRGTPPAGAQQGDAAGQDVGKATPGAASLFTVRRELHFRLDREDLDAHRLEVLQSNLQAGPLACSSKPADTLRPLLAGQRAGNDRPAGTDPYAAGPDQSLALR